MKLDELKKKLYKPEDQFGKRIEILGDFQSKNKDSEKVAQEWKKTEKKKISPQIKKKISIIGISIAVVFMVIAIFFIWRGFTSFDKNGIEIEINGPERVVSGEEIKYTIKYKNNTRMTLENVKLIFHYPEDSISSNQKDIDEIINLSNIEAGQEKEVELLVRVMGLKGEEKKAWTELSYQPLNFSSRYVNEAEFISEIISVPLILDFDLPEKLVSGQSFNFSLKYLNQAEVSFDDVRIRFEYPNGFVFESANEDPLENDNVWHLGKLMAGEQGKIFIQANIQGEENDVKSFKAELGFLKNDEFTTYAETVGALQISSSPLSVTQTINDNDSYIAKAGDKLSYQINYKNTTNVAIKDVIITSKLEGDVLDLTSLELIGASFNGGDRIITWNAGNLSALGYLGPYQEGKVNFTVNVKSSLPIKTYSDKNFTINNTVKIDSLEIPFGLEDIEIAGQSQTVTKVSSQINFQAQGHYYDDLIPNSGPIPPKIGETTTYTIKWRLVNTSNDLKNVKVIAFLPPHVTWVNKINPGYADLKYNSQTGQVIWTIGDLQSATGILLPAKEVAFQISITPSLANLGDLVELIGQSKVSGQDDFVGLELISFVKSIDTDLPDDLKIGQKQGKVVQ